MEESAHSYVQSLGVHFSLYADYIFSIGDVAVSITDMNSAISALRSFFQTFSDNEPILLIKLRGIARFKEEHERALVCLFGSYWQQPKMA